MTPNTLSERTAHRVSAALVKAGLTQKDVEAGTGIPQATLSRRLTGKVPFNVVELGLIADLLDGVTASDLIGDDDDAETAATGEAAA